jgi:hypothetical protein
MDSTKNAVGKANFIFEPFEDEITDDSKLILLVKGFERAA